MKLAFLVPVALFFMVASALAQTVTEVETRGKEPTYPDYKVTGGSEGGRGADTDSLEVTFALPDGLRLPIGETYDYEVTVTNKSKKEVLLPRSTEWSDLVDGHPKELKYDELEVQFIFAGRDTGHTYLGGNLLLYGRVSKPSTMIALQPGDFLRVRGRVTLNAPWMPIPADSIVKVHMEAALILRSAWLHPAPDPVYADAYSNDRKEIYFIRSENMLPAELTTKEAIEFPPKPKPPTNRE